MCAPSELEVNVTPGESAQEPLPPRGSDSPDRAAEQSKEKTAPDKRALFLVVLLRALSAWHT